MVKARIELLCSGTELLKDKLNSNSCLIAERLGTLGLSNSQVTTVGDIAKDFESALRSAIRRSDVVLTCGGLGPTFDDLTRECVSKVLQKPLVFSRPILNQIKSRFAKLGRAMPPSNERQAYVVKGARAILNTVGTAPGQIIALGKKSLILLPGPPNELLPMVNGKVLPYLAKRYGRKAAQTLVLHIVGHPESEIDEAIAPVVSRSWSNARTKVSFGILAHKSQIDVKASVEGNKTGDVRKKLSEVRKALYEILGDKVYGENEETLESVVGKLLKKRNQTLALAESCTGGLIAHKITNVPGSSDYLKEGLVTYSNESKIRLLGVKKETLWRHGAVSEPTAREMAEGARKRAKSSWAVSVTGIAGPGGGSKDKPVGLICFGIASPTRTRTFMKRSIGNRLEMKKRFAVTALELLRREILGTL